MIIILARRLVDRSRGRIQGADPGADPGRQQPQGPTPTWGLEVLNTGNAHFCSPGTFVSKSFYGIPVLFHSLYFVILVGVPTSL